MSVIHISTPPEAPAGCALAQSRRRGREARRGGYVDNAVLDIEIFFPVVFRRPSQDIYQNTPAATRRQVHR